MSLVLGLWISFLVIWFISFIIHFVSYLGSWKCLEIKKITVVYSCILFSVIYLKALLIFPLLGTWLRKNSLFTIWWTEWPVTKTSRDLPEGWFFTALIIGPNSSPESICLTVLLINRRDNIYRFTENFPIIRFIKRNEVSLFYNLFDPQILYIYILYVDWLWDLRKRKLTGSNNGMVFCIHLRGCHRNQ